MTVTRAFIFDMDGVLIHSSDIHRRAFALALADEGVELPDYTEIAGMRTDSAIEHIFGRSGVELDAARCDDLVQAKRRLALQMLEKERPIAPQCVSVLTTLQARGYGLALASSASSASVDLFLRVSETASLFAATLCGDEVANAKPAPDIFLAAAERLEVPAQECVVVEDSKSGVTAGCGAGSRVVGVAGETSPQELLQCGAEEVIHGIHELIDLPLAGG